MQIVKEFVLIIGLGLMVGSAVVVAKRSSTTEQVVSPLPKQPPKTMLAVGYL